MILGSTFAGWYKRLRMATMPPRKAALADMVFTRESPAPYEAMFSMPTGLQFAEGDVKPEQRAECRQNADEHKARLRDQLDQPVAW